MVLISLLLAVCVGAAIGARFRVYVLVLAIAAVVAIVLARGVAADRSSLAMLGEVIGMTVALQVGYLLGTLGRIHVRETPATRAANKTGHFGALTPGFSEIQPD
jgi:hypothetical protein